jgi:surface-anchored protein
LQVLLGVIAELGQHRFAFTSMLNSFPLAKLRTCWTTFSLAKFAKTEKPSCIFYAYGYCVFVHLLSNLEVTRRIQVVLHAFRFKRGSFRWLSLALGVVISAASHTQADFAAYSDGHADVGVAYAGPGALELHWHMADGAVVEGVSIMESEFEPDEIRAIVPTFSSFARGAGATWDFIGNSAGQSTYYLPEVDTPGIPFLGFGSEELDAMEWTTPNLSWTISSFSGPGQFSIFQDLGTPTVAASTFLSDFNFNTILGGHSHFNLAFTQPGIYDVEFTVSGTHGLDGLATDVQTFRFDVTAVPEPSSIGGALVLASGWAFRRRRKKAV